MPRSKTRTQPDYDSRTACHEEDDDDSSEAADERPSTLPQPLRKDGPLQAALVAAEETGDEDARRLARSLSATLCELRRDCRRQIDQTAPLDQRGLVRECVAALAGSEPWPEAAAVLRLMVVLALTDAPPDRLWAAGTKAYLESREAFDRVLGPAVPEYLRRRVDRHNYNKDANPTALGDWPVFLRHLAERPRSPVPGVPTGFGPFDDRAGGLSGVTVLAGDAGSGKTTLALQLAAGAVRQSADVGALVYDAEMGKDTLYLRLLSAEAGVPCRQLVESPQADATRAAVADASLRLQQDLLPRLRVESLLPHRRSGGLTFESIQRTVVQFRERAAVARVVIVVDSLQRMTLPDVVVESDDAGAVRRQRVPEAEAMRARMDLLLTVQGWTRTLSSRDGFPIICVSRTRKATGRGRLELADVYGGTDAVFDAGSVLLLEPASGPGAPGVTPSVLNLAKVRDWGSTGDLHLDFNFLLNKFSERSKSAAAPAAKPSTTRFRGRS